MKSCEVEESFNPSTNNITSSYHKLSYSLATQLNLKPEESTLTTYKEIKAFVDHLKTQKHQFRAENRELALESEEKIKKNREDILKIDKKIEKLEQSNQKLNINIANEKYTRIEEFKSALLPLQTSADLIENTKTQLQVKIEELAKDLENLNGEKESKQIVLDLKMIEFNKVNFEIQTIRRKIEEVSKDHQWDHMEVFQESKTRTKVAKIKQAKKEVKNQLLTVEDEINTLKKSELINAILNEFEDEIESFEPKIEELNIEIQQLEAFFNLQSKKHSCKEIWEILVELSQQEKNSILDYVAREQVNLIKIQKMQLLDSNKNLEWLCENKFFELNAEIKGLEVKYYEKIKEGKKSAVLEKTLNSKKQEFAQVTQEYESLKKKNSVQLMIIEKWLETNRKILTISESSKLPEDNLIVKEFLKEFSSKNVEKPEREAIENAMNRYIEKVNERTGHYMKITATEEYKVAFDYDKIALASKRNAEIKTKEIEKEKLEKQFEVLQKEEKALLQVLEKYKLEIDSGRRSEILELINKTTSDCKSKQKVTAEQIKAKYNEIVSTTVQLLRGLCEEKAKAKSFGNELMTQVKDKLRPEITALNKEILLKSNELKKLEEDSFVLENSKEELLDKLGLLADKKREEMYKTVKSLNQKHGSAKFDSIEKLYLLRSAKEAEIIELELKCIKNQKLLSEKELKNSMEIIKLTARAEALDKSAKEKRRHNVNRQNRLSCFEIGSSFLHDKSETHRSKNSHSINKNKSYAKLSDTMQRSDFLRTTLKTPNLCFEPIDFYSEVALEIPCPPEPKFVCSEFSTDAEKSLFESILPLLEGCVLYKKAVQKSIDVFDPLEFSIKPAESCGYNIKKMKINKQLTKIEVRQIGKPGIENCIMIDSILSINSYPITNSIIKAQNTDTSEWDNSLENLSRCSKEYRDVKYIGKVNHSAPYFVLKSKETHFYPFYLMLKTGKLDLIADSIKIFYVWMNGLQTLIKNKNLLEGLKFKIQTACS